MELSFLFVGYGSGIPVDSPSLLDSFDGMFNHEMQSSVRCKRYGCSNSFRIEAASPAASGQLEIWIDFQKHGENRYLLAVTLNFRVGIAAKNYTGPLLTRAIDIQLKNKSPFSSDPIYQACANAELQNGPSKHQDRR